MSSSRDDFTIAVRSALLQKGTRHKFSLFFLLSLSVIIFFLDIKEFTFTSYIRSTLNDLIYRVSNVATSPARIFAEVNKDIKKSDDTKKSTDLVTKVDPKEKNKKEIKKLKPKSIPKAKNKEKRLKPVLVII